MAGISDKKARILVVDDDREIANVLMEYLRRMGYEAEAAYGGGEGIERFKNGDFQMVITDMKMPDMDGMEVMKTVRSMDKHVLVLVITGYSTIHDAVEAIKAGAYDCISKPFDFKSMEVIIRRALERHTFSKRFGELRGLTLSLFVLVPILLILAIVLAYLIIKW